MAVGRGRRHRRPRDLPTGAGGGTLAELRSGFQTRVVLPPGERRPAPEPEGGYRLVRYSSPVGSLAAYVTPRPLDGGRRPAVIWLSDDFSNSIDPEALGETRFERDVSPRPFQDVGMVVMVPSLRGAHDNPGRREALLGEVDDVLAAADHLRSLDYVAADQIYLAGHGAGATLALLSVATAQRFRAVFAFGPASVAADYGAARLPLGDDPEEARIRSPLHFIEAVLSGDS